MEHKKTTFPYRVIRALVAFFYHRHEVVNTENLPEEACVVVGNHAQMNGPIIAELYYPRPKRIWCAAQMMKLSDVPAYAYKDFWSSKPAYIRWFFKLASYVIAPLSVCIFNNADTIPVYHDSRTLITFRRSMEALLAGQDLVIYPECYDRHNNIVYEFQNSFVDIARLYYRKTGKDLCFVPLYNAPALKRSYLGKAVKYDHTAPAEQERERICSCLMDEITALARSLPRHRVVPYPNVPKRDYPFNDDEDLKENEKTDG